MGESVPRSVLERAFPRSGPAERPPLWPRESVPPLSPEARDSVPFGLKRRIPVGLAVLDDQESRRPSALPVPRDESRVVGLDRRVGVDDQEVAFGKEVGGVSERARRSEDFGLGEEAELRKFRRAIDQVLLDLLAEMVEIDGCLADPESSQTREVRARERHVEIGEERLRDAFGDRPEADSPAGGQEKSAHQELRLEPRGGKP